MFENDDVDQLDTGGQTDEGQQTENQPTAFEIPDDAFVSVKVDGGESKLLPWKDVRDSGVQFQSAFTKKTQELAQQRQAFETERQQITARQAEYETRLTQLQSVISNPQALAALYMHVASQQTQPQQPQPLDTSYLPKLEQTFDQKIEAALGKLSSKFSQERQAERYEQDMDTFMSGVLAKHPVLQAVEGIEDTIYGRVAALKPKSVEEAKELARTMVEGMAGAAHKAFEAQAKADALTKARAASGIEPRGGAPAYNRPPTVKKLEDMDNAFITWLQQADRAGQ